MGLPTWGTIDRVLTDEVTGRGLCTGEGVLQYRGLPTWEGGGRAMYSVGGGGWLLHYGSLPTVWGAINYIVE